MRLEHQGGSAVPPATRRRRPAGATGERRGRGWGGVRECGVEDRELGEVLREGGAGEGGGGLTAERREAGGIGTPPKLALAVPTALDVGPHVGGKTQQCVVVPAGPR